MDAAIFLLVLAGVGYGFYQLGRMDGYSKGFRAAASTTGATKER